MEEAFASATTLEEIFKAFEDMASAFDQDDFFLDFLKASLEVDEESEDQEHEEYLFEDLLDFGDTVLKILEDGNKAPLPVAMTLHVMGTASFILQRFNMSLGYLDRANTILIKLEEEGVNVDNVRYVLFAVIHGLFKTNIAMGRSEEAIRNNLRCLELKEKDLGIESSMEAGAINRKLAEDYVIIMKFNDALPLCLKAIEIHMGQEGKNSVLEVAYDRRLLGLIYTGLEEHDKAREQTEISSKILEDHPNHHHTDQLHQELTVAVTQIKFRKYEEALGTLRNILQLKDIGDETAISVLILMARAFCHQQKDLDTKMYLDIACADLDWRESSSMVAFHAHMDISMIYEMMNEFETAISRVERCMTILVKIPQQGFSKWSVSARIGRLLVLKGKPRQAITYFGSAAEILIECFGREHIELGYVYNNLGAAYLELGMTQRAEKLELGMNQMAEKLFSDAHSIIVASLGPDHAHSIIARENLSKAYDANASCSYKPETKAGQPAATTDASGESHGSSSNDEVGGLERQFLGLSLNQGAYEEYDDDDDYSEAQRARGQVPLRRAPPPPSPEKAVLLPIISEATGIRDPRPS